VTTFEQSLVDLVRRVVREELASERSTRADLVTVQVFAAAHSISPSTVRAAIRDGRLPAVKVGRAVRVRADAEIGRPVEPNRADAPALRAEQILKMVRNGR
jgi:excisionase family DNA binding protein